MNRLLLCKYLTTLNLLLIGDHFYILCHLIFNSFRQVLEIMSVTRNEDLYELANIMYENSKKLFKI
jgi:hypothetical protein